MYGRGCVFKFLLLYGQYTLFIYFCAQITIIEDRLSGSQKLPPTNGAVPIFPTVFIAGYRACTLTLPREGSWLCSMLGNIPFLFARLFLWSFVFLAIRYKYCFSITCVEQGFVEFEKETRHFLNHRWLPFSNATDPCQIRFLFPAFIQPTDQLEGSQVN